MVAPAFFIKRYCSNFCFECAFIMVADQSINYLTIFWINKGGILITPYLAAVAWFLSTSTLPIFTFGLPSLRASFFNYRRFASDRATPCCPKSRLKSLHPTWQFLVAKSSSVHSLPLRCSSALHFIFIQ